MSTPDPNSTTGSNTNTSPPPNASPTPTPTPTPPPNPPFNILLSWWGKPMVKHVLLSLSLIALIWAISIYSRDFAEKKAIDWLNVYNGVENTSDTATLTSDSHNAVITPQSANSSNKAASQSQPGPGSNANGDTGQPPNESAGGTSATPPGDQKPEETKGTPPNTKQQGRLDEQLKDIRARIRHHGDVMAFFYKAYYMSTSVIMLAGLIAALTLFFIAQSGWTGTNAYVKNIFLVMTAATAYYGLFPSVFQQQQNITDNKALFLSYKALEGEVVSYPITGKNIKGESKKPDEFINYIDAELNRIGNIAIGFDSTKISYKDAFDTTERQTPSANRGDNTTGNTSSTKPGNKNQ